MMEMLNDKTDAVLEERMGRWRRQALPRRAILIPFRALNFMGHAASAALVDVLNPATIR